MIDYGLLLPEKRRVLAHGVPRPLVRHARGEADAKAAAQSGVATVSVAVPVQVGVRLASGQSSPEVF